VITVRQRHAHVSRTHPEDRCDSALLLAAGDQLASAVADLHLRQLLVEGTECLDCDATEALFRWKKVTDG